MSETDKGTEEPQPNPLPKASLSSPSAAAEIRARLRATGEALPESLHDAAFAGENNEPALVIDAAEGVGTFHGFNGTNPQPAAEKWLRHQFRRIAERYSGTEPSATPERDEPPARIPGAPRGTTAP